MRIYKLDYLKRIFIKNTEMISKIILGFFLISMIDTSWLFAQCPPSTNDWHTKTSVCEPKPQEFWGAVSIKYNNPENGVYEIKVEWSSLSNYLNRTGITDEEFKQIMLKALMMDFNKNNCDINQTPLHFKFYEETECKVTKRCWVKCDAQYNFVCADPEWGTIEPTAQNFSTGWVYPIETTTICGTQCCITDYTVVCIVDPDSGMNVLHIIDKVKYTSGASCSSTTPDCHPWYPPINCESDCN